MSSRLYEILSEHLTPRKRELFDAVAAQRTRYFTVVLEDIYHAQNTSAVLRSAEAWGMQELHVIENRHSYSHHRRIARGANDWLTVHRYNESRDNSAHCFDTLRRQGYQVAVTALHENAVTLDELDLSRKTAVVFGTELTGASSVALEQADVHLRIPMYGFTESLNVSVASGVIIRDIAKRIRLENRAWQLSDEEKMELKIQWARKAIRWSDYLVEMYEAGELS